MLLHLIEHAQLKNKLKGVDKHVLMIVVGGGVMQPLPMQMSESDIFTGPSVATYELSVIERIIPKPDFERLRDTIAKEWKNAEVIFKVLKSAQSLTIRHLENVLKFERDDAKQLMTLLAEHGAYLKYYSYWRRTAYFQQWLCAKE